VTDDTLLDARVRAALTDLPVPDDRATREALVNVLERSGRSRHEPRRWIAPTLVAATVVLAVLLGMWVSRPSPRHPVPAPSPASTLLGDWQHQVTGSGTNGWDGRWRMALTDDGVLRLSGPETVTASIEGASYAATAGRLRIDAFANSVCDQKAAGLYTWQVSGDALVLALVEDPCAGRVEVFAGTWRRVS
jgi:hypothetical protein